MNERITKQYEKEDLLYTINLDILTPLEKDIIYKTYIRKPRIIKKYLATEYNISKCEVDKIISITLKKLKCQYIIDNNITYL